MIGVLDYGLGNVRAFENIFRRLGIAAASVKTPEELETADRLILPGVGAFDWAMSKLQSSGMLEALNRRVLEDRVPVLGVCVGMQIMAGRSEEGTSSGLGWIRGRVERFEDSLFDQHTRLPHMGWNTAEFVGNQQLFANIEDPQYYFLHSYFFLPEDPSVAIAYTHYGTRFVSALRHGNIYATQFHPEKSHEWGVCLLKNFAELV